MSPIGFEPMTASLEGRCSIQLSYEPVDFMFLRKHTFYFVGVAGFEPATSSSQTRRDNRATLHPECTIFFAERQGLEPWRQLPVDRLAICSITTLAPLLLISKSRFILKIASANVVLQLDFRKVILINFSFFYSGYSTRK